MPLIITLENPERKSIALQTSTGRDIPNEQFGEIPPHERNQFPDWDNRWGWPVQRRGEPSPLYNCHGLTFACRRTSVYESSGVRAVLEDDAYHPIELADVLPGDVILYYDDNNDIEHSGIVVTAPAGDLRIPLVVSKWGKYRECVHPANHCPYNYATAKFFRSRA
jgi:hypothetical protein